MKKKLFIPFILVSFLYGCGSSSNQKKAAVVISGFTVQFFQNNKTVPVVDGVVLLNRSSFSIIVRFRKADSVLVNASYEKGTYTLSKDGEPIEKLIGFKGTGIDEYPFNPDRMIYLSKNSPNYWNYNSLEDNRFNLVKVTEDEIICERNIDYVVDLDNSKNKTAISKIESNSLYLVFIQSRWNDDYSRQIELSRQSYNVKFGLLDTYDETLYNGLKKN